MWNTAGQVSILAYIMWQPAVELAWQKHFFAWQFTHQNIFHGG